MTHGCEFRPFDAMNNLELLMVGNTMGHELSIVDTMNNLGL